MVAGCYTTATGEEDETEDQSMVSDTPNNEGRTGLTEDTLTTNDETVESDTADTDTIPWYDRPLEPTSDCLHPDAVPDCFNG